MYIKTLRGARPVSFSGRGIRISTIRSAAVYAAAFALILLASSVDRMGLALAIGLFAGFAYARLNVLLLGPMLIAASVIFSPDWYTVIYSAVPVLLFVVLYGVCYRLRRNVEIYFIALAALLSMVPYAVMKSLFDGAVAEVAVFLVVGLVTAFCASIVSYAVVLRRINSRFTLEEQICGGILTVMLSYALSGCAAEEFCFCFAAAGFIVILAADCFSPAAALMSAVVTGLGASVYFSDAAILGAFAIYAMIAVALSSFTRFASAAGVLAAGAAIWLSAAHTGAVWQNYVMLAAGVLLYLLLPKRVREPIRRLSVTRQKNAVSSVVNRDRGELAARLYSVSDVFYDMSKTLDTAADIEGAYTPQKLAKEIAKNYCGKCADREKCFLQLGDDTASVLEDMAAAALNRGKVTILDMPPFITGKCSKMHNLASVISSAGDSYRKRKKDAEELCAGKRMMSEQFAGVSLVLDSLAKECSEQVSYFEDTNEAVSNELLKHNIVASEVVIFGGGDSVRAAVTVRESDADKAVLPKIVSQKLRTSLTVTDVHRRGDRRVVHLESSPVYEVAYGVAEHKREGEEVSGDSKSILCPSRSRRLFAISDGMGGGDAAAESSRQAIAMVENFYRAGFDNGIILSLVNKLLQLNGAESFSSLDIAVIDTVSGAMDVIKMGAADSFIVRRDSIESISSSSPPVGILDGVKPVTNRVQLYDGDMVILMSDGVFDALDTMGVNRTVEELDTLNPQTLADELVSRALGLGASDDCTAMVLRIFCL